MQDLTVDGRVFSLIFFNLGVLLQAAFLIRRKWNWWKIPLCLTIANVMSFLFHYNNFDLFEHFTFSFSVLFPVIFGFAFKKPLLPQINAKIILSYSVTFWFVYLSHFSIGDTHILVTILCIVLTIVAVDYAFSKYSLHLFWKMALYLWYFSIVVFLGICELSHGYLSGSAPRNVWPWDNILSSVLGGMAFLFLVVNAIHLLTFLIWLTPGDDNDDARNWNDAVLAWRKRTSELTQHFGEGRRHPVQVAALLLVQGAALVLSGVYHFLPVGAVVNVFELLPAFLRQEPHPNQIAASHASVSKK